ncbi:MAG: sulfite exporter TauE/SafE family protein [Eggerthellaceae bacterium]|nr:sulfite exporter TauE/SafE family protein [Eggerthellaceae bacterium]
MQLLIVCPLSFIAGFVDAVAGGGGLIALPAFVFAGIPIHNAIGTNKLASAMGTTVATIRYALSGYMVRRFVLACVPCALLGSWGGSSLAMLTDDRVLQMIVLFILPFAAFFVLRTKDLDVFSKTEIPIGRAVILTAVISLAVGMYDGFYGPGTGTFLMLLFTSVCHQDVRTAAGTTKAANLSTNLAALVVYLVNGVVLLPLGLCVGLFNIAGNYVGASKFTKNGSALARPIMLVVITLFAVKLIFDLFV